MALIRPFICPLMFTPWIQCGLPAPLVQFPTGSLFTIVNFLHNSFQNRETWSLLTWWRLITEPVARYVRFQDNTPALTHDIVRNVLAILFVLLSPSSDAPLEKRPHRYARESIHTSVLFVLKYPLIRQDTFDIDHYPSRDTITIEVYVFYFETILSKSSIKGTQCRSSCSPNSSPRPDFLSATQDDSRPISANLRIARG